MRGKSHRQLGEYLVDRFMNGIPRHHIHAFLLGCVQPDKNPATYLKGSFQHQWLRGHNYHNSRRFMGRIAFRLERKERWSTLDYYSLGKLIHYTADAFTCAHNEWFSTTLADHREYEKKLQIYFLEYLRDEPSFQPLPAHGIMSAISNYHREYQKKPQDIRTDSIFALNACCSVLAILFISV